MGPGQNITPLRTLPFGSSPLPPQALFVFTQDYGVIPKGFGFCPDSMSVCVISIRPAEPVSQNFLHITLCKFQTQPCIFEAGCDLLDLRRHAVLPEWRKQSYSFTSGWSSTLASRVAVGSHDATTSL